MTVASIAASAYAQSDDVRGTFRIEVTGSHIVQSDVESALPVQVITRDDIERGGFTTPAALMASIAANVGAFTDSQSVGVQIEGKQHPGLSSVNLRGIGDGSTLVLINGRRVANYAFDGGTVDVNSIPMSAIDRVEILKDGASAIYGTDAIGGVVNFILRKDFRGVEVAGQGNWTQHGGGDQYQATITAGYGDLATDRFNAFVTLNYQKDGVLRPGDRSFLKSGFRDDIPPDAQVFTRWTFPANIITPQGILNPGYDAGCTPPTSRPVPPDFGQWCGYDAQRFFDVLPEVTRVNAFGRATYQASANLQLFAELGYSDNKFALTVAPTAAGGFAPYFFSYPAGGPFYPTAFAAANGITGNLNLLFRTEALGARVDDVESNAARAVVGAEGRVIGWDYSTALVYSRNRQTDDLANGYVSASRLAQALATGLLNPFGPSGAEGDALLRGTEVTGRFHDAQGTTWLVDGRASRDLVRLPGGFLAVALGAEARHEQLDNTFSPNGGDVLDLFGDLTSISHVRTAQALYGEASIPVAAAIESQIALRYDHYSDFGGTLNPKVALRWQPVKSILLRASWGTGFRAPTLYDLYTPQQQSFTSNVVPDPVRCPVTHSDYDCGGEFPAVIGGNPNLQPEKSEQFNAGIVFAPTPAVSLSIDYWSIREKNLITAIDETDTLFPGAPFAASNVIRGPEDPRFPGLPGPIESVVLINENLGTLRTSGFDVGVKGRLPQMDIGRFTLALDGTYVSSYRAPFEGVGPQSFAGNNNGPYAIPRWRHYASLAWKNGPWGATLAQTFQSGYDEQGFCIDVCTTRRVGSYSVWNLQGRYAGFRHTTLTAGIINLFDREPPFVLFQPGKQAWFDGSYADPRGRTFYVRMEYAFK